MGYASCQRLTKLRVPDPENPRQHVPRTSTLVRHVHAHEHVQNQQSRKNFSMREAQEGRSTTMNCQVPTNRRQFTIDRCSRTPTSAPVVPSRRSGKSSETLLVQFEGLDPARAGVFVHHWWPALA
uniref:Uncharacterized protein n=1 Tax=Eutreptiella gymnastica TaxID=73025 RepID=A0A7S4LAA4_9EUGL